MSSLKLVPPVDIIHSIPKYILNSFIKLLTCNANSLVGINIIAYILFFLLSNFSNIGITYAPVFPVPFLALAMILLPANANGMHSS